VQGFAEIVAGTIDKDMHAWLPRGYNVTSFDPKTVVFNDPARRLAYSWYGDPEMGDSPFDEAKKH
jgi:hypothetical protein